MSESETVLESSVITPALCRKILALREGLMATENVSLFTRGEIQIGRSYRLIPRGSRVEMLRVVDGKVRPLRKNELTTLENRFRHAVTHELARHLGPADRMPALDVDRVAAVALLDLVLAKATAPIRARAHKRVELAIDDPSAYLRKYPERGELPRSLLHAFALFDALGAAGAAADLDPQAPPAEVRAAIGRIARRAGFDAEAARREFTAPDVVTALRELSRSLAGASWTMVQVDLRGDSRPFFVVRTRDATRLRALLRRLRIRAEIAAPR